LSFRSDDLDSVGEAYTEHDFRQLVVTVETAPAFLGGLGELEDHGERGLVRETSLGALLAFYDFPAEHWKHLRTTNVIESSFATIRHRTVRDRKT
jgi:mutator family transposase